MSPPRTKGDEVFAVALQLARERGWAAVLGAGRKLTYVFSPPEGWTSASARAAASPW